MSEPTNAQIVEMNARNARVEARWDALRKVSKHGFYETLFQVVREEVDRALEASPSTEQIIEWMARAIFNAHQHLGAESTTWDSVEEPTRERFRSIARHELEAAQKA